MSEISSRYKDKKRILDTRNLDQGQLETLLITSGVTVEFFDEHRSKLTLKYFLGPLEKYDQSRTLTISVPKFNDIKIGYITFTLSPDGEAATNIRKAIHPEKIPGVELRSQGYMSTAHSILAEYLKKAGVKKIVQDIESKNIPSLLSRLRTRSLSNTGLFFSPELLKHNSGYDLTTDLTKLITETELREIIDQL